MNEMDDEYGEAGVRGRAAALRRQRHNGGAVGDGINADNNENDDDYDDDGANDRGFLQRAVPGRPAVAQGLGQRNFMGDNGAAVDLPRQRQLNQLAGLDAASSVNTNVALEGEENMMYDSSRIASTSLSVGSVAATHVPSASSSSSSAAASEARTATSTKFGVARVGGGGLVTRAIPVDRENYFAGNNDQYFGAASILLSSVRSTTTNAGNVEDYDDVEEEDVHVEDTEDDIYNHRDANDLMTADRLARGGASRGGVEYGESAITPVSESSHSNSNSNDLQEAQSILFVHRPLFSLHTAAAQQHVDDDDEVERDETEQYVAVDNDTSLPTTSLKQRHGRGSSTSKGDNT
jgi:hypothetical protein